MTNAAAGPGTEPDSVAALPRESGARVTVHAFDPAHSDGDLEVSEAIRPGRWRGRPLRHRAAERALRRVRREL